MRDSERRELGTGQADETTMRAYNSTMPKRCQLKRQSNLNNPVGFTFFDKEGKPVKPLTQQQKDTFKAHDAWAKNPSERNRKAFVDALFPERARKSQIDSTSR